MQTVVVAGDRLIVKQRQSENVPLKDDVHGLRYQLETLIALQDLVPVWQSEYPPYSGAIPSYSPQTELLYESTHFGLGIMDPQTGIRRYSITKFPHKDRLPDSRTTKPWAETERIWLVTSDGSLVCLRHP